MVATPTIGPMSQPPIIAPTTPTTTFKPIPCCELVCITMLASQPITPPITNQMIKFMSRFSKDPMQPETTCSRHFRSVFPSDFGRRTSFPQGLIKHHAGDTLASGLVTCLSANAHIQVPQNARLVGASGCYLVVRSISLAISPGANTSPL